MWPSVSQIITTMNEKDEELKNMMDSLDVFITHIDELIGVFENDYNGGDFCAGLKFGYNGSNLLSNIAETIVTHHVKNMQNWLKKQSEYFYDDHNFSNIISVKLFFFAWFEIDTKPIQNSTSSLVQYAWLIDT